MHTWDCKKNYIYPNVHRLMHRSMGNVVLVGVQRGRNVRAHLHVCWRSINEGDDGTKIYRGVFSSRKFREKIVVVRFDFI